LLTLAVGQVQLGKGFPTRTTSWPAGAATLRHPLAAELLALLWRKVGKFFAAALHLSAASCKLLALFGGQHGFDLAAAVFSNGLQLLALGIGQIQPF
jgi:hypothetical protein